MKYKSGQIMVLLLVMMVIGIMITSAAVILTVTTTKSTSKMELGTLALSIAHSGGENAMMRLLRNPSYTGETLTIGNGTATVTVTGTSPKTITSIGRYGNFIRTVQIVATGSGFLTVSSWKEN